MTPSRSRTMSLTARGGDTDSVESWTMALGGQLGDVGDAVHRPGDAAQQREAVRADHRIVGHDEHVVEEAIDDGTCRRQRLQGGREVAPAEMHVDDGFERLEREEE